MSRAVNIAIILSLIAVRPAPAAEAPPRPKAAPLKISVDRPHHAFIDAVGKPFVPFGVTYYRPGTGWAPQLWKEFDAEATRRDFARLKKQGASVVRVFISFGSFYTEPGRLDPDGLAKFDRLLDLADEAGLYVHPTGPDAWEGMPAWTAGVNCLNIDANEPCMIGPALCGAATGLLAPHSSRLAMGGVYAKRRRHGELPPGVSQVLWSAVIHYRTPNFLPPLD